MVETHPEKRLIGYARVLTYGQPYFCVFVTANRLVGC
jgi:hypothetical protein